MADHHFWPTDVQFARLQPLLPNKACGVPRVDDRRVISGIVRRLESSGETEIPVGQIGETVMDALANLDPVAYVRFASVYRNFREAKDFEDFIGSQRLAGDD